MDCRYDTGLIACDFFRLAMADTVFRVFAAARDTTTTFASEWVLSIVAIIVPRKDTTRSKLAVIQRKLKFNIFVVMGPIEVYKV